MHATLVEPRESLKKLNNNSGSSGLERTVVMWYLDGGRKLCCPTERQARAVGSQSPATHLRVTCRQPRASDEASAHSES